MADMLAELPSAPAATLMRQVGARTAGELRALIEKHEEWTKAQAQQGKRRDGAPAGTAVSRRCATEDGAERPSVSQER